MLRLQKSQTNEKSLHLKESDYYLFAFDNSYFVIPTVTSTTDRAVGFSIVEQTPANGVNGELSIQEGDYELKIYEQKSNTNLDPNNSDGLIWTGRAFVEITDTNTEYNQTNTVKYYGES